MALVSPSRPYMKVSQSFHEAKLMIEFVVDHIRARNLSTGHCLLSPAFSFGGSEWVIHYYPAGASAANQGLLSVFLVQSSKRCANIEYFVCLVSNTGANGYSPTLRPSYNETDNMSGFPNLVLREKVDTIFNIGGNIHLQCHMKMIRPDRDVEVLSYGGLHEHIKNLWVDRCYFDVTFQVGDEFISAHRLILAARSPVFRAALFGNMAESSMSQIQIVDMRPQVFKELLQFMYTDKVSSTPLSNEFLRDLLVASDRYAVYKLETICEELLADNLSVKTFAMTLVLADRHSCSWLKEKCFLFASDPKVQQELMFDDDYMDTMSRLRELRCELRDKVRNV